MKSLRAVGMLVAVTATVVLAAMVRAEPCRGGCDMQKKACLATGRVAKLACRRGCRATAGPASRVSCLRGCADRWRAAKGGCASDHADCVGLCPPTPPPGSCTGAFLDGCGQDLGSCARGVVTAAKTCVQGCGAAPDTLACLQVCAATAQQGAETCAANFATCVATCACPGGCDDGNPCSVDRCVGGACTHECVCVGPTGDVRCCPGPGPCPAPSTTTTTLPTGCQTDADCNPDGNPCVLPLCVGGTCEQFCTCLHGESFTCAPDEADKCQSVADCAPPLLGDPCRFCVGGLCMGHPFCV